MKTCPQCNAACDDSAAFCPSCGFAFAPAQPPIYQNIVINTPVVYPMISVKSRWAAFFLCLFLGVIGIHRFYVGKVGTGILWLFTGGCFGIGALIDLIVIACGGFRDYSGARLVN